MTDPETIQKILSRNKRIFLSYNKFRKDVFAECSPKDSEVILYMLPWLLSVNEPGCPGYLPNLGKPFRVFNIEYDKEIKKREGDFKSRFGVAGSGTLIKPTQSANWIHGIYTIGSVGTVSQNDSSDCDLWICFEKDQFDKTAWVALNQKVNLIKGWMDTQLKLPVYFFISDVAAVKEGRFGSINAESSGTAQQNVLKEEFYRTFILVSGKIPVWWLMYDKSVSFEYEDALSAARLDSFWEYDLIDLGNLEKINSSEYFGAALWQFHKFLTRPLKSITKMILLKMLLDASQEWLMCHRFREAVLSCPGSDFFPDHSLFTMSSVLDNYRGRKKEMMHFLTMCFYLRCETRINDKKQPLKSKLMAEFFQEHPLDRETVKSLRAFDAWSYNEQMAFGNRLYRFMLLLYREISADQGFVASESDKPDLTILGRKISASCLKKNFKVPILQKPVRQLNLSILTLNLAGSEWQTFSGDDKTFPIFQSPDIVENIAFIVWNNLFAENWVRMRPNPSSITLKEILNLSKRIRDFFGAHETLDVELNHYLREERIVKILVVIGFDKSPWDEAVREYTIVYMNNWGELFVRRFDLRKKVEAFLKSASADQKDIVISKYLRRNPALFEKNIEIPKKIFFSALEI